MKKQKESNKKSFNLRLVLILAVLGGFLVYQSASDFISSFQTPVGVWDLTADSLKPGQRVSGNIDTLLDAFSEEITTRTDRSGSSSSQTAKYYVLPVGEKEYIALRGAKKDTQILDQIVDETYEYLISGTVGDTVLAADGVLVKMDSDVEQYFH